MLQNPLNVAGILFKHCKHQNTTLYTCTSCVMVHTNDWTGCNDKFPIVVKYKARVSVFLGILADLTIQRARSDIWVTGQSASDQRQQTEICCLKKLSPIMFSSSSSSIVTTVTPYTTGLLTFSYEGQIMIHSYN